jgi:hypothetical protein
MRIPVSWLAVAAVASLVAASSVAAQQPRRVRGTIAQVSGSTLTVHAGDAGELKVHLADGAKVYDVVQGSATDIKPGAYVGVGAMPQTDGTQKAIQVVIFADALRGIGEGHRPWDRPGNTMTNGTADALVGSVDSHGFTVKYKDGEKKIVLAPDTVIRAYVDGSADELKPGPNVATFAVKKPDGTLETARINVGRNGVVPQ